MLISAADPTSDGQAAHNNVGHAQPPARRGPTARILLAAGDAGGGQHDPYARRAQRGAGAPDSEAAGVIESHRWPEKDPDGGVFGERV